MREILLLVMRELQLSKAIIAIPLLKTKKFYLIFKKIKMNLLNKLLYQVEGKRKRFYLFKRKVFNQQENRRIKKKKIIIFKINLSQDAIYCKD